MPRATAALALLVSLAAACNKGPSGDAAPPLAEPAETHAPGAPVEGRPAAAAGGAAGPKLPPDAKYENVLVEGKRVPMVQVMNGGEVLLVDVDGAKPRTWEEQYKRKGAALRPGQFDLHKTDSGRDGRFDDDPIDRQGRWQLDERANLSAY